MRRRKVVRFRFIYFCRLSRGIGMMFKSWGVFGGFLIEEGRSRCKGLEVYCGSSWRWIGDREEGFRGFCLLWFSRE